MKNNGTTQKDVVLNHLQMFGTLNMWDALHDYGVGRLAAVIHMLRQEGHMIDTESEKKNDKTYFKYIYRRKYRERQLTF